MDKPANSADSYIETRYIDPYTFHRFDKDCSNTRWSIKDSRDWQLFFPNLSAKYGTRLIKKKKNLIRKNVYILNEFYSVYSLGFPVCLRSESPRLSITTNTRLFAII